MSIKLMPKPRVELGMLCLALTFVFLGVKGLSVNQGIMTEVIAVIFIIGSIPIWMMGLGIIRK